MTDTPDTSPEAVERLANRLGGTPLYDGSGEESDLPDNASATLRALSAALESAEMSAKHWHARAKAAEAELDEALNQLDSSRHSVDVLESRVAKLKAELAEAVGVAARLADWIEHEAGCDLPFDARAIIARHQKGADT